MNYVAMTELNQESKLLNAAAIVGVNEEKLIRGFTDAKLLFTSDLRVDELERLFRSPFVGKFGGGWLQLDVINDEMWDDLLEEA